MRDLIMKEMRRMQYGNKESLPTLPAITGPDQGCVKDDAEFAQRAADLILGAECDHFDGLLGALAQFCAMFACDTGDEAYKRAGTKLAEALSEITKRKGC